MQVTPRRGRGCGLRLRLACSSALGVVTEKVAERGLVLLRVGATLGLAACRTWRADGLTRFRLDSLYRPEFFLWLLAGDGEALLRRAAIMQ